MNVSQTFIDAVRAARGNPDKLIEASLNEAFSQPDGVFDLDHGGQVSLAGRIGVLVGRYANTETFVDAFRGLADGDDVEARPTDIAPPEYLSADVAVLLDIGGFVFDIFLIRRGGETEHGKLAFAGGKKNIEDLCRIVATAVRELFQEMGITITERDLKIITILDGPGHDPRGDNRTSVLFAIEILPHHVAQIKAGDDASEVIRLRLADVPLNEMAFNHAAGILELRKHYT